MTYADVLKLIKNFETSNLTSLDLEIDKVKIKLSKQNQSVVSQVTPASLAPAQTLTPEGDKPINEKKVDTSSPFLSVKSPLVGTFYAASSPNAEPFVKVGQKIKKGQVVCIIEAMKIMNEITSPYDGLVEKIELKSGNVVGFDQTLMLLRPSEG